MKKINKPLRRPIVVFYLISIAVLLVVNLLLLPARNETTVKQVGYSTFLQMVDEGKVTQAEIHDEQIAFKTNETGEIVTIYTTIPMDDPTLVDRLQMAHVEFERILP